MLEDPSLHVLFAGNWSDEEMKPLTLTTRRDASMRDLDRYGVRSFGIRASSRTLAMPSGEINDLDVQRALANEVDAGRIQHVDANAVYIAMLDTSMNPTLGGTRDWLSYHSQFHPTELPLRYVVVRGGLDRMTQHDAMDASLFRAMLNPAGDGWF